MLSCETSWAALHSFGSAVDDIHLGERTFEDSATDSVLAKHLPSWACALYISLTILNVFSLYDPSTRDGNFAVKILVSALSLPNELKSTKATSSETDYLRQIPLFQIHRLAYSVASAILSE